MRVATLQSELLVNNNPLLTLSFEHQQFDWEALKHRVTTELTNRNIVQEDLLQMIKALEQSEEDLNLRRLSGFQVCKFPLVLLRVNLLGGKQIDRYIVVEMNAKYNVPSCE